MLALRRKYLGKRGAGRGKAGARAALALKSDLLLHRPWHACWAESGQGPSCLVWTPSSLSHDLEARNGEEGWRWSFLSAGWLAPRGSHAWLSPCVTLCTMYVPCTHVKPRRVSVGYTEARAVGSYLGSKGRLVILAEPEEGRWRCGRHQQVLSHPKLG